MSASPALRREHHGPQQHRAFRSTQVLLPASPATAPVADVASTPAAPFVVAPEVVLQQEALRDLAETMPALPSSLTRSDVPAMPLPGSTSRVADGLLTIELNSRLLRRVHYDPAARRMGVVFRTGRMLVHVDVPPIIPDMIGRHPTPGYFYKETLRPLLERPLSGMSPVVLGFRWRVRKAVKV